MSNKTCLIIINKLSGHYTSVNEGELLTVFGKGFDTTTFYIEEGVELPRADVDRVVVCGGDGTLNNVINLYHGAASEIIYCPYGTLNETSHQALDNKDFILKDGGLYDGKFFSYVLATGTFTPLGYAVKTKVKQHVKSFAYIASVLGQLKVWRIKAELTADGVKTEGEFSLIMVIDSPNCFGLHFNKLYAQNDGKVHLLTVKAPRFNGFFGLVEMFFPFFRAFFIGFDKPYKSKRMSFAEVHDLAVKTEIAGTYCVDGEKRVLPTEFTVTPVELNPEVKVYSRKTIKNLFDKEAAKTAAKKEND